MIKIELDDIANVDEKYQDLYTKRADGKFALTGIEGLRSPADFDRVQRALTNEKENHKKTKEKFGAIADLNPEEIVAKLDRIEELEAAAAGKLDEGKLEQLVSARLNSKVKPIERELNQSKSRLAELEAENLSLKASERRRSVHEQVRSAATKASVIPTAVEDVLLLADRMFELDDSGVALTKDGGGVTPGVSPDVWLVEMQDKRPHWWPASVGGGASGGAGSKKAGVNPWSKEHWNRTEQGAIYRENPTRAEQLARAAGTTVTGGKPE